MSQRNKVPCIVSILSISNKEYSLSYMIVGDKDKNPRCRDDYYREAIVKG